MQSSFAKGGLRYRKDYAPPGSASASPGEVVETPRGRSVALMPSPIHSMEKDSSAAALPFRAARPIGHSIPRAEYQSAKRILDLLLATMAAPIVFGMVAMCAVVIFLTMGRPIFFGQERVGFKGRTFWLWKLRSMTSACRKGEATAVEDDHRITPFGRLLRRSRLDELPQLLNVFRGEMSIIGPRPEQPGLVAKYRREIPGFDGRHRVLPGISGLAQVTVGYCSNAAETRKKLRMDLHYIRRMSFALDCAILWRSVLVVLTGHGSR